MSKACRLVGIHDLLCIDHELDRSVVAGLELTKDFAPIFSKASHIITTIRTSNNLFRQVRDVQVLHVFILTVYIVDMHEFFFLFS